MNYQQSITVNMLRLIYAMPKLVLYKMNASPPACAIRILGEMIRLEFDLKDMDFFNLEHKSPEFIKINPMGTVPTLIDDDFIISDSNAIIKYLLTKYGGEHAEQFYPSDARTRALVDQSLFFNAGIFFIRLKVIVLPTVFEGATGATTKQLQDIDTAYGVIENYLAGKKFIAADHLTIADLEVGMTTASFELIRPIDGQKFPRTVKWYTELKQIPEFKKYADPCANMIGSIVRDLSSKNKQA